MRLKKSALTTAIVLTLSLLSACATKVSSPDVGCQIWEEKGKRGVLSRHADETPAEVLQWALELGAAFEAGC